MADVEIYRYVNGMPLEKVIANTREAQSGVRREAMARGRVARAILAAHRDEGDARISVESGLDVEYGHIDHFVVLDDTAGLDAAMTIEKGRKPGSNGQGGMEPVAPLGKAFPELGGE